MVRLNFSQRCTALEEKIRTPVLDVNEANQIAKEIRSLVEDPHAINNPGPIRQLYNTLNTELGKTKNQSIAKIFNKVMSEVNSKREKAESHVAHQHDTDIAQSQFLIKLGIKYGLKARDEALKQLGYGPEKNLLHTRFPKEKTLDNLCYKNQLELSLKEKGYADNIVKQAFNEISGCQEFLNGTKRLPKNALEQLTKRCNRITNTEKLNQLAPTPEQSKPFSEQKIVTVGKTQVSVLAYALSKIDKKLLSAINGNRLIDEKDLATIKSACNRVLQADVKRANNQCIKTLRTEYAPDVVMYGMQTALDKDTLSGASQGSYRFTLSDIKAIKNQCKLKSEFHNSIKDNINLLSKQKRNEPIDFYRTAKPIADSVIKTLSKPAALWSKPQLKQLRHKLESIGNSSLRNQLGAANTENTSKAIKKTIDILKEAEAKADFIEKMAKKYGGKVCRKVLKHNSDAKLTNSQGRKAFEALCKGMSQIT